MADLVHISVRAERDLAHIYRFINATESQAANEWYLGLQSAMLGLERLPNRWPVTHENSKFRYIRCGNKPHVYRVIYLVDERLKRVEILHIRHGARGHLWLLG